MHREVGFRFNQLIICSYMELLDWSKRDFRARMIAKRSRIWLDWSDMFNCKLAENYPSPTRSCCAQLYSQKRRLSLSLRLTSQQQVTSDFWLIASKNEWKYLLGSSVLFIDFISIPLLWPQEKGIVVSGLPRLRFGSRTSSVDGGHWDNAWEVNKINWRSLRSQHSTTPPVIRAAARPNRPRSV